MNRTEKAELEVRLVCALEDAWSARMLDQSEKIELATELAEKLTAGPGWMVRQILAVKAGLTGVLAKRPIRAVPTPEDML